LCVGLDRRRRGYVCLRSGDLILREFADKDVLAYAILSHTWSPNNK
jgi:hypothetical protein